jgi:hypothetical protein
VSDGERSDSQRQVAACGRDWTGMKEHCAFSVQGMDLECPLCGELVKSGNSHACDKDGGVSSRRTVPIKHQNRLVQVALDGATPQTEKRQA